MVSSSVTEHSNASASSNKKKYHYKIKEQSEKLIPVRRLENGMILSRDVQTNAGQLLFQEGTTITSKIIEKAKQFNISRLHVRDYQTRWIDKETLEGLPDTVTPVEKKEIPAKERSEQPPPGNGQTFKELFELISQTSSPDKLRDLLSILVENSDRESIKTNLLDDLIQDIRNHTDNMEEHVKHILGGLSSIDDKQDRAKILKQLLDDQRERGDLDFLDDVPGDIQEAVMKVKEQKNMTKTGLQDIIHEHSELTNTLTSKDLPDTEIDPDPSEIEDKDGNLNSDALLNLPLQIDSDSDDIPQNTEELLEIINNIDLESFYQPSPNKDSPSESMEDLNSEELDSIRSALNSGSPNNSKPALDHLMDALKRLEAGQWHSAIEKFEQCVEESSSVGASPVNNLLKRSNAEAKKRPELEKRLEEASGELDPESIIDQLLEPEQNETIDQLRKQGIPQPLIDELLQYQESVKSLAINTCQALSNQLPDILDNIEEDVRNDIIRNFNDMVERLKENWLNISGKWELYERQSPEHGTVNKQSEKLNDALKRDDINDLKQHTELPEEVVEQYRDLYKRPQDGNKWQKKLINSTKKLMNQLVLTMTVPETMIEHQLKQIRELYQSKQKPFSLLCSPPEPEQYHLVHAYNSCLISVIVGLERDLPDNALKTLIPASLLADIGLTIIPPSLYLKQVDLSKRADNEISKHPIYSREIVERIFGEKHSVTQLVSQHHEHIDGGGYPRGLNEDQLHPLTPILSASDVYTARLEDRIYRSSQMPDLVLKEMLGQTERYHQSVVKSIVRCIGYYPDGSLVKLNNGQIALVQGHNQNALLNPDVILLTDTQRSKLDNPRKKSLSEAEGLEVELIIKT